MSAHDEAGDQEAQSREEGGESMNNPILFAIATAILLSNFYFLHKDAIKHERRKLSGEVLDWLLLRLRDDGLSHDEKKASVAMALQLREHLEQPENGKPKKKTAPK